MAADVGHFVVLPGRAGGGFLPAVCEETVVFEASKQRVKSAFDHNKVRLLEALDNFRGVCGAVSQDKQDAEFEHTLAHLRFEVFDVHNSVVTEVRRRMMLQS